MPEKNCIKLHKIKSQKIGECTQGYGCGISSVITSYEAEFAMLGYR